jgi:protoheme IX farnesyltransferase
MASRIATASKGRRKRNVSASRNDCWIHHSGPVPNHGLSIWLELGKVRITAAVSITTITGYLLNTYRLDPGLGWTVLGIFLLASGASSLNHLQEYRYDSQMQRTRNRPLPSGRISRQGAVAVTLAYSIPGSLLLYIGAGMQGMLLGWLAFFWYNVVYTYLKRYTAWSVIPGSIIGSIPPVIGWVSAGGSVLDPLVAPVAAFFYIWQVPHFWLLIMKYGKEYESAGFPSLSGTMSQAQMGRMIFLWVSGTAMITVAFSFVGPVDSSISKAGLWIASAWLILTFTPILKQSLAGFRPGRYFMKINYFVLLVVVFMCLDKLLLEFLHI